MTDDSRDRAHVTEHHIEHTAYSKYPGNYHGISDEWDANEFHKTFRVDIIENHKGRILEFDMIGIGPAIANAYRRIMIAEVPSMAIEHCFIYNNTSVIQDEMLAHRVGLIPIRADPTQFRWKPSTQGPENVNAEHTIRFTLKAKCEKIAGVDADKTGRRDELYQDYKVHSGKMVWVPIKGQEEFLTGDKVPRPAHKKILVAKLSGKQEIDLKLHAVKGIGRDHAKFSPVATATYRLMPDIKIIGKVTGDAAERIKSSFSEGVIKIDKKDKSAKVANARIDSGSRNIFRHQDLKDLVVYDYIKDHFIFKVESAGGMPAMDIVSQSCAILGSKCQYFLNELQSCRARINVSTSVIKNV